MNHTSLVLYTFICEDLQMNLLVVRVCSGGVIVGEAVDKPSVIQGDHVPGHVRGDCNPPEIFEIISDHQSGKCHAEKHLQQNKVAKETK